MFHAFCWLENYNNRSSHLFESKIHQIRQTRQLFCRKEGVVFIISKVPSFYVNLIMYKINRMTKLFVWIISFNVKLISFAGFKTTSKLYLTFFGWLRARLISLQQRPLLPLHSLLVRHSSPEIKKNVIGNVVNDYANYETF